MRFELTITGPIEPRFKVILGSDAKTNKLNVEWNTKAAYADQAVMKYLSETHAEVKITETVLEEPRYISFTVEEWMACGKDPWKLIPKEVIPFYIEEQGVWGVVKNAGTTQYMSRGPINAAKMASELNDIRLRIIMVLRQMFQAKAPIMTASDKSGLTSIDGVARLHSSLAHEIKRMEAYAMLDRANKDSSEEAAENIALLLFSNAVQRFHLDFPPYFNHFVYKACEKYGIQCVYIENNTVIKV